jgi:hypothetical protein
MLLSPIFNDQQFQDNSGNPLAGGRIFQYEAGSFSVLQTTYTDESGAVANANPIVLDSSGRLPGNIAIWLQPGQLYNLVLTAADGTTVLKSFDDVSGVLVSAGGGGGGGTSVWVETPGATYLSPTSFLVPGNVTAEYAIGNRVRCTVAGPTFIYGTVQSVSFGGGNTTVIIQTTTAALNASLSLAEYSILIASGMTVDAAGVSYNYSFNYTDPLSIGFEVKDLRDDLTAEAAQIDRLNTTWGTSGSGANTPFTITASPAPTSLTADSTWSVRFVAAGAGDATLNVNGLGAKRLRSYNAAGALVNATIPAGFVSTVTYDVTNDCYIVQNRIPQALPVPPRGAQGFGSNGTFTCPADVFVIKVTCVGGGGGGGSGSFEGFDPVVTTIGGTGGAGGVTYTYLNVTPSTGYAVAVGAGGTGAPNSFGAATAGGTSSVGITLASAPGGGPGGNGSSGGNGATGSNGFGGTGLVLAGGLNPYGFGGAGSVGEAVGSAGAQGLVYIEW